MALVRRRCFRSKWHTDEADAALTNSFPNLGWLLLVLSGHCAHPVWGLLLTFTSWRGGHRGPATSTASLPGVFLGFLRDRPLSVPTSEIASFLNCSSLYSLRSGATVPEMGRH